MDKKAAKEAKKAAAEAAKLEKEEAAQRKVVEEFNDKQSKAKAASNTVAALKEWLANPPYKSTDEALKVRETKDIRAY